MTTPDQRAALAQELEALIDTLVEARSLAKMSKLSGTSDTALAEDAICDWAFEHAAEVLAALRSPAAAQTSDARDAARYRWLREAQPRLDQPGIHIRVYDGYHYMVAGGTADIAVDHAIAASGEAQSGDRNG